jgi:hypothetical protein
MLQNLSLTTKILGGAAILTLGATTFSVIKDIKTAKAAAEDAVEPDAVADPLADFAEEAAE